MKKYLLALLFALALTAASFDNSKTAFAATTTISSTRMVTAVEKAVIEQLFNFSGSVPLVVDAPDFDPAFTGSSVDVNTVGDVNPPDFYQEVFVNAVEFPSIDPCYTGDPLITFSATVDVTSGGPGGNPTPTPAILIARTSDNTPYAYSTQLAGAGTSNLSISTTIPKAVFDSGDFYLATISQENNNFVTATYSWSNLSGNVTYDDSSCAPNNPPTANNVTTSTNLPVSNGQTMVTGSSFNATDVDGDTLSYAISAGNGAGYFAIDSVTGNITTTTASVPAGTYNLSVDISDGNGGVKSVQVTITIADTTKLPTLVNTGTKITLLSVAGLGILMAIYFLKKRNNVLNITIGRRSL